MKQLIMLIKGVNDSQGKVLKKNRDESGCTDLDYDELDEKVAWSILNLSQSLQWFLVYEESISLESIQARAQPL